MNLKKGKFKIVEGTRVRMVSSKDTHIVEGAYGTVVSPGIRESEVRWDSMLAIRADYRYRNELEDALIIPVYNKRNPRVVRFSKPNLMSMQFWMMIEKCCLARTSS